MAKKKKTLVVDDGTNTGQEFAQQQELNWDDIKLARTEAATTLISQQMLQTELVKMFSSTIEADKSLKETVIGISNSYNDITDEILGIDAVYNNRTGVVQAGDEELEYLQIAERYIAIQEKVANIAGSGLMDVFVTLRSKGVEGINPEDITKLAEALNEGKQSIIDTVKTEEAKTAEVEVVE